MFHYIDVIIYLKMHFMEMDSNKIYKGQDSSSGPVSSLVTEWWVIHSCSINHHKPPPLTQYNSIQLTNQY